NSSVESLGYITKTAAVPTHHYEKETIQHVLEKTGYSMNGKKEAAQILGLSIATLYRRLKKYDITS
ncbi:helix-turn-helix domain-containing protein, partial [Vibrio parahaemolyticus]|nr:helix-turn-helix domain-containing protein [Vibrio parahaemolyticus]